MPNADNKAQLEEIKSHLQDAGAVWCVDYRGLSVKEIQQLRRDIRANDAQMFVFKNTLMHIALEELDMPSMDEILSGPSAFVFTGEDPVASAKAIKNFAKTNELLEIKGGLMDGAFQDAAAVQAIPTFQAEKNSSQNFWVQFPTQWRRQFALSMQFWKHQFVQLQRLRKRLLRGFAFSSLNLSYS